MIVAGRLELEGPEVELAEAPQELPATASDDSSANTFAEPALLRPQATPLAFVIILTSLVGSVALIRLS